MDFASARTRMVDNQIRTTDVTDNVLLRAFLTVPRERFVPEDRREFAYIGGDVKLSPGRWLMEASPLAKLLQLADVREGERVLVVGAGMGYSCAILAELGARPVALEEDRDLLAAAAEALADVPSAEIAEGALKDGFAKGGPYDVILFEGSVDIVPEAFFQQLAERGRLLAVVGHGNAGMAKLYLRDGDVVSDRFGFNCALEPLPGLQKAPAFTF